MIEKEKELKSLGRSAILEEATKRHREKGDERRCRTRSSPETKNKRKEKRQDGAWDKCQNLVTPLAIKFVYYFRKTKAR